MWTKKKDGLGFAKRRLNLRDYAQLQGWDKKSQTQYLDIPRNSNQALRSNLSQSQLLAALGNSFSVPVFQAIAENMLKCFNGLKAKSDFDDSDSDEPPTDPDEWQDPNDKKGPDDFHKKQKLSDGIDELTMQGKQKWFGKANRPRSVMFGGVPRQIWATKK